MLPLRKPKRRPSDIECRLCGQVVGWARCEGCQGYGSWDPGLGAFDCVLCGGVGWQQEPHTCLPGSEGPATQDGLNVEQAGEHFGPGDADDAPPTRSLAAGGRLGKILLATMVLVVLFLILATAAAGLFASLR